MKQTIKTCMLAALLLAATNTTFAQNDNLGGNRPSREQMVEKRANSIAKQLGLDAKTSKKFLSVYKSEQNDMKELMPGRGGMPPRGNRPQGGDRPQGNPPAQPQGDRPQENPPSMNGNTLGKGRPRISEDDKKKMESLKQKYNKKYAKFLSQDQITKMYQLQEQERGKNRPDGKR